MTDRATIDFFDLLKESAEGPLRKAPPGMRRDAGITEQGIATKNKNQGVMVNKPAIGPVRRNQQKLDAVNPALAEFGRPAAIQTKLGVSISIFLKESVHPLEYSKELLDKYGKDWIDWEPETLWETIRQDYGTNINEESKNKIMAMRVLLANELFWNEWEVFEKVVAAFNDRVPSFGAKEDVSLAEIAYTVTVANKIKKREYGPEVQAFVAVEAFEEGYVKLPEVLRFSQDELDGLIRGTEGEAVRDKLEKPLEIQVTDPDDPVHIQAGILQAVQKYIENKDTVNP